VENEDEEIKEELLLQRLCQCIRASLSSACIMASERARTFLHAAFSPVLLSLSSFILAFWAEDKKERRPCLVWSLKVTQEETQLSRRTESDRERRENLEEHERPFKLIAWAREEVLSCFLYLSHTHLSLSLSFCWSLLLMKAKPL